jgi:glycosyltransferase involved in cell wall biosynthesis
MMRQVLYIVPYKQLFPPENGGMLRNYFLVHELSKYVNLTLVILQHESEFRDGEKGYAWNNAIRIVSPDAVTSSGSYLNKLINAIKGRYYRRLLFESANGFLLQTYPKLKRLLKAEKFDVVVFAHLQSLVLQPLVKKYNPNAFCVMDAHNVDHALVAQEYGYLKGNSNKEFKRLRKEESSLYKKINAFMACSFKDKHLLEQLNGFRIKGLLVPNGADTDRLRYQIEKDYTVKSILFCGSLDYLPNQDGLLWFYNSVWPNFRQATSDLKLTVIGRNGTDAVYDLMKNDSSVDFIGQVDIVDTFYLKSTIAIVPLRMGSGTRLKILEAMSLGCPVVSTSIGAEGIEYEHFNNIMIADSEQEIIEAINFLLINPEKCEGIRTNARKLIVEKYSWTGIGRQMAELLIEEFINYKNS